MRDWLTVTKPMIMFTVALTTAGGIYLSRPETPISLVFAAILGVTLCAAGSAVLNNVFDREIDKRMSRTCRRPVAAGRIAPERAILYAVLLTCAGFSILLAFTNLLCVFLVLIAYVTYAGLYTRILKPRTPFAAVPGGIAGAMPPLAGAAAVSGGITSEGLLLFALMFVWQPAHFWYLTLRYKDDYEKASIPVLPLRYGDDYTRFQALLYVTCLLPLSFLPYKLGMAGQMYFLVAGSVTLVFFISNILFVMKRIYSPMRMFFFSITHLFVVFMMMVVDKI